MSGATGVAFIILTATLQLTSAVPQPPPSSLVHHAAAGGRSAMHRHHGGGGGSPHRHRRPPHGPPLLLSLRPGQLIINDQVRGADQRQPWVRAVAAVHPVWRTAVTVILVTMLCLLLLIREGVDAGQCTAWQLGVLQVCQTVLQAGLALLGLLAVVVVLTVNSHLARLEELKDAELTTEDLAAAASAAALAGEHATTPAEGEYQRLQELHARGVDSGNWRVDRRLSTPIVAVLVNWYTQTVVIAFRGSVTLGDWASNVKTVIPGKEHQSRSFRSALDVARAAQRKYVLCRSIWLTGHSRGGSMADYIGRSLGMPSLQINPGSWGKLFFQEEPAVDSHTVRNTDLISLLEAVVSRDRRVSIVWPRRQLRELACVVALALLCAVLAVYAPEAWLRTAGLTGCAASVLWYISWMHSVLRFTKT